MPKCNGYLGDWPKLESCAKMLYYFFNFGEGTCSLGGLRQGYTPAVRIWVHLFFPFKLFFSSLVDQGISYFWFRGYRRKRGEYRWAVETHYFLNCNNRLQRPRKKTCCDSFLVSEFFRIYHGGGLVLFFCYCKETLHLTSLLCSLI